MLRILAVIHLKLLHLFFLSILQDLQVDIFSTAVYSILHWLFKTGNHFKNCALPKQTYSFIVGIPDFKQVARLN